MNTSYINGYDWTKKHKKYPLNNIKNNDIQVSVLSGDVPAKLQTRVIYIFLSMWPLTSGLMFIIHALMFIIHALMFISHALMFIIHALMFIIHALRQQPSGFCS